MSRSATAGLASWRASRAPGGQSVHGAENDCVLTCSDGFEAADGTEAGSSVSRQLLAGRHGESCHCKSHWFDFPTSLQTAHKQARNGIPGHTCPDKPALCHVQVVALPAGSPQERLVLPQAKPGTTTSYESLIHPPFDISNGNQHWPLSAWGAGVTASHANGRLEYNVHNLYGLSEAVATNAAMQKITGNKPFLLSR